MEKLIWGVIGVGNVCEKKSAPGLQKVEHSEIKTVMRRNVEKAADFAQRHNVPNYTGNAEDILNDPEINAVYIATPPSSHTELALKAAAAGKITYVEKPMANSFEECQQMVDAFKEADLPLFVAYYRRALPNFLKIKELVDSGTIDEVRTVNIQFYQPLKKVDLNKDQSNWRVDPDIAGGGYFNDLASHQLDYLDYLLGPIKTATGIKANQSGAYEAEDIVSANWVFENGVIGNGIWCFSTAEIARKDYTIIIGDKGTIEYETFGNGDVILKTNDNREEVFHFQMPEHIQQPLIQKMVNELRGEGECPSTGTSAARTNAVMDMILK
ncbi:Gfo/Idh/MocA family protein [Chondrinema litorale]|uniref:Gfo/Idh/MocA family protein n=1 Tax=Chondrinema litorale TaxID=2994555 RepID=UPI0032B572EE